MIQKEKHFYCLRLPHLNIQEAPCYQNHAGELIITTAVSPEQAAVYAIVKRFKQYGDIYKKISKHLHASFKRTDSTLGLTAFVLDIDEADKPIRQLDLFVKSQLSHKRLNEIDIANKIASRYKIPNKGENSIPRRISRDYIQHRREFPLTK